MHGSLSRKRSIANKLLYEPTGPKWMLFKKKKGWQQPYIFIQFFHYYLVPLLEVLLPDWYFCCPVQKSRSFAPIFLLLPVKRTIVHLENFDRNNLIEIKSYPQRFVVKY